ncbi:autotransporter secretion outer membrane protein TamA [Ruegeria halocynthiae]|uniref:Autotransporter secretion outer membrane protein TamA n=1 Tax=Ruegeria halocynthiae TaxID=985054 RepID=A0A1H2VZL9_9RHOB|nr:BamA/TamA family outer membrane protein [Ruegeria halocynthiae]SDW73434.1 autotransporter secretion outer membrane protein TamA [Ruegeria halocynthiae]
MTGSRPRGDLRRLLFGALVALIPNLASALETTLSAPGASEDLVDRLEETSSVFTSESRGLDTSLEILSAALSDYRTIVQIMYDEGYFSPVVSIKLDGQEAANINSLNVPAQFKRAAILVTPGRKFKFGTAVVQPVAPGTELPEEFARGKTATTGAIQQATSAGVQGWRNTGHAKAEVSDQKVIARHAQARLDATIDLAPGPRLRFGKMIIQGDTDVRHRSIEKISGFPSGEVYSPEQVQKVGTRLRRTGTFSTVSLKEHDEPNPDGTLDFDATFEDLPPRRLTFGAEIASRDGVDVTATWTHRNVFRRAQRLRFEAAIRNIGGAEDIDGRIGLRLDQPDRLGPDDSTFWSALLERRNTENYNVSVASLAYGARRTFSDRLYAEASAGFQWSDADDAYGDGRKFRYFILPFRSEWDERDSKVSATRGYYLDSQVMPFLGFSGSDTGLRMFFDGRAYNDLGTGGRLVLAGRVQLGSVLGPPADGVTPDFLFFSGGAGTVRGQPYESLGIPVGDGVAGGKSFLGLSAEVRGKVTDTISLVGFYDYGVVDTSSFIGSGAEEHSGAGLGIRYDLGGFGPLRFDLAVPVQGNTGDGLQFYLGIGQAF